MGEEKREDKSSQIVSEQTGRGLKEERKKERKRGL
jgi:hypothetical protein